MGFFSPNGSANRYVGIWYNNVPRYNVLWVAKRENPILVSSGVMTISNDGNLVVMNAKRELVWSSNVSNSVTNAKAQLSDSGNLRLLETFQHMTDSFLGEMKLSTNSRTNEKQALTSWKSPSDPSIGSFSAIPEMQSVYINGFNLVDDHEGTVYLTYSFAEASYLLEGFEPRNFEEWSRGNWSSGCIWKSLLQCNGTTNGSSTAGRKDGFLKLQMMKPGKLLNELFVCSICIYDSSAGCMLWIGELIDLQKFSVGGTTLYIQLAHSELEEKGHLREIVATTVIIGTLVVIIIIWFARWKAKKRNLSRVEFQEFVKYKIEELAAATANFGEANKLGRGGFGPVYKGRLPNGQEIAIKRLSRASGQGQQEFMNEPVVICKVQRRNLVRLLGCCVEGDEKTLIYEIMPKESGHISFCFLFAFDLLYISLFSNCKNDFFALNFSVYSDPLKQVHLDWRGRFNIVDEICRGLLHFHRDSSIRIIHRDLKTSNILLDEELNPKISDFEMARIFEGNENQANTQRFVGTYSKYAMEGQFLEKSNVFSFSILLLKIVSGKRNMSFHDEDQFLSLIGLAWKLWNEENVLALVDSTKPATSFEVQLSRCIDVGLHCTQERAKDWPSISTVISMIDSEIVDLPRPKQPAFTARKIAQDLWTKPKDVFCQRCYSYCSSRQMTRSEFLHDSYYISCSYCFEFNLLLLGNLAWKCIEMQNINYLCHQKLGFQLLGFMLLFRRQCFR
ncbi:hypothetical protein ACJRO7_017468 [Eucalyptus globulus]|uniref:Receptor-like serine/threonine-protein kinase n=1 Tax=Eucalyptus globulus TaxID=34317 RepID=A0ABD3KRH8_EUCGL